ncbi:hypothetical protein ACHAXT_005349 [Thalassiosira profunda]
MAAASKAPGGNAAKAPPAKGKEGEDTQPPTEDTPPPTDWFDFDAEPVPTSGRLLALYIIAAIIAGAIVGGYVAVHFIEAEYKKIVTKLQSDHRSSLEQRLIQADRTERAFQIKAEQYLTENIAAIKIANEGLDKASARLKLERDLHGDTKSKLDTTRNALRAAQGCGRQRVELQNELNAVQAELDATLEELDRRDVERVECDEHHRNMLLCQESLKDALTDLGVARTALLDEGAAATEELAAVTKQRDEIARQVEGLIEVEREWELKLQRVEDRCKDAKNERAKWEKRAATLQERIAYRNKHDVLQQYGTGPYHVKVTLEFASEDVSEIVDTAFFVLELGPLEEMPHTVYNVMKMVKEKTFVDGTMILAQEHILVGGPVDVHDKENNDELEQRMVQGGYFPGGLLLFNEHSAVLPHAQWTIGFNEVGGPVFYINLRDNTKLHGPNGRGEVCFGKITEGVHVIQRVVDIPRAADGSFKTAVYIADTELVDRVPAN